MKPPKRIRPKIGDIIEIQTSRGFAYAQFTHRSKLCGPLIRILPGVFTSRPTDFDELVNQPELYFTFFFLSDALKGDIVKIVTYKAVPEHARAFPLFKAGVINNKTGRVDVWWLWDGEKSWKVGDLTPEQYSLPDRSTWNDVLLADRIGNGWKPENDVTKF